MKVVYVFLSRGQGVYHLMQKTLPQLAAGSHDPEIVGMCFFDDNANILEPGHPYQMKLAQIAQENNIVLMRAETQDLQINAHHNGSDVKMNNQVRRLKPTECAVITVAGGAQVGCFPDLYAALGANRPDHVISL